MSSTTHHFAKRDSKSLLFPFHPPPHLLTIHLDMGYEIPPTIIVLLIILGSLFVVCLGYAIHSTFGFHDEGNGIKPMSVEQMEYMAEVRVRNMRVLDYEGSLARGMGGRRDRRVEAVRQADEVVYSDGDWSEGGGVREV